VATWRHPTRGSSSMGAVQPKKSLIWTEVDYEREGKQVG
jgi:hypothetical protein